MSSHSPAASKRRARLTQQLQSAHARLSDWETSIRANLAELSSANSAPFDDVQETLATLVTAKQAIERRLREIGAGEAGPTPTTLKGSREATRPSRWRMDPMRRIQRLCLKACQACGRSIAAAFRRARASADLATAQILYGAMRAFEKQIWLLDPHHARPQ